jgi:glycosyltransferase involved in cell wall biosynthesis
MIDEIGRCADKVEILGNGFDPGIFSPAPANRGKKAVRALWIGQIGPVKGVDRLIRSLARIADRQPSLLLTLLGAGDGTPEMLALAAQLGIRDRISVQPPQDRAGVAAAIRAHDFVVVSSHKETFSLAALEALACGRPVLTTACGGPEDFVINGENGLVVPNSEDGLAQGLATMALTHKSFNARGISQAARSHTWDAVSEKLLGVYKQVLEEGVSAPVAASAAARPARQAGSPS